jgi:pimeloyl-ACP methyl ester carboxylesterase
VGIGRKPPVYLKAGDSVSVSINGLGTLVNQVADPRLGKPPVEQVKSATHMRSANVTEKYKPSVNTMINGKPLCYHSSGDRESTRPPIVFVHGLGGSNDYFAPLIHSLRLQERHMLHAFDFEGHGLSPTSPLSQISIESLAADLNGIFACAKISSDAIIIAHDMGCLIATKFALNHSTKVSKLILLGPPPSPLSNIHRQNLRSIADFVRADGMLSIAKMDPIYGTSRRTRDTNQLAVTAIKMSLLSQDPEGYRKAVVALADAEQLDFGTVDAKTLIVTGSEDEFSPPGTCENYVAMMKDASVRILEQVGHWHIFEDCSSVAEAVEGFIN